MYNEKYREGGGVTPYVAPNITVEPYKELVYDEIGNIRAIVDRKVLDSRHKQDNKDEFFRVLKKAVIITGLFALATVAVYFVLSVVASIF